MDLITFKAPEGFSQETHNAWRYMSTKDAKTHPYFVLDDEETQACGIRSYDPIFGTNLIICQGNRKECEEYVKRQFPEWKDFEIPRDVECYAWHLREGRKSVIWLSVFKGEDDGKIRIISILAHEAIHCAFATSKFVGIFPDNNSEEFFTYYTQWVMNQYLDALGYNPEVDESKVEEV